LDEKNNKGKTQVTKKERKVKEDDFGINLGRVKKRGDEENIYIINVTYH